MPTPTTMAMMVRVSGLNRCPFERVYLPDGGGLPIATVGFAAAAFVAVGAFVVAVLR